MILALKNSSRNIDLLDRLLFVSGKGLKITQVIGAALILVATSFPVQSNAEILSQLYWKCLQALKVGTNQEPVSSIELTTIPNAFETFQPERKEFTEIHPTVQTWLMDNAMRVQSTHFVADEPPRFRGGNTVKVDGLEFVVLFVVGFGAEGYVYLVDGPTGLVAIKTFFKTENLYKWVQGAERDPRLPKVLLADANEKLIVIEYAEGIPLDYLINLNPTQLPQSTISSIATRWEESPLQYDYGNMNVVYSFARQDFLPFDPW